MFAHYWIWNLVSRHNDHLFNIDTEEVNKALDEIHDEIDKVMVSKTDLNDAL
jgi:hypothetical protein